MIRRKIVKKIYVTMRNMRLRHKGNVTVTYGSLTRLLVILYVTTPRGNADKMSMKAKGTHKKSTAIHYHGDFSGGVHQQECSVKLDLNCLLPVMQRKTLTKGRIRLI